MLFLFLNSIEELLGHQLSTYASLQQDRGQDGLQEPAILQGQPENGHPSRGEAGSAASRGMAGDQRFCNQECLQ